jgi:hypothetical protein
VDGKNSIITSAISERHTQKGHGEREEVVTRSYGDGILEGYLIKQRI